MNQCTNARAASLEQCKRMLATPHSLPFLFDLIPLILLRLPLFSSHSLLCVTCLSYLPSLLHSHPLLPSSALPSYLFSPFPVCALLHWAGRVYRFYFLPFCSCSSFPGLFLTLCPFIVFKEWKRKKEGKGRCRWKRERRQRTNQRGRRVKEERLKAHYFPTDGRKWVRGQ